MEKERDSAFSVAEEWREVPCEVAWNIGGHKELGMEGRGCCLVSKDVCKNMKSLFPCAFFHEFLQKEALLKGFFFFITWEPVCKIHGSM